MFSGFFSKEKAETKNNGHYSPIPFDHENISSEDKAKCPFLQMKEKQSKDAQEQAK